MDECIFTVEQYNDAKRHYIATAAMLDAMADRNDRPVQSDTLREAANILRDIVERMGQNVPIA